MGEEEGEMEEEFGEGSDFDEEQMAMWDQLGAEGG